MKRWASPLGGLDVAAGPDGVSAVALPNGNELPPIDDELAQRLDQHIRGRAAHLKLDFQGLRPLAQVTLAKLLEIPHGEVRSYAWVAREIGRPSAVRAVATAVANNPIPVLVPCHRVVRSDGAVGDFSFGGVEMKRRLLAFEGIDLEALEAYAVEGVRYLADDSAGVFHVPSCSKARVANARRLTTIDQAHESHLESCPACRPI